MKELLEVKDKTDQLMTTVLEQNSRLQNDLQKSQQHNSEQQKCSEQRVKELLEGQKKTNQQLNAVQAEKKKLESTLQHVGQLTRANCNREGVQTAAADTEEAIGPDF